LLHLYNKHSSEALEKACETALSYKIYRLKPLRQILKRQPAPQRRCRFWKSTRSSSPSTIMRKSSHGRSIARQIAHPWAKVLRGMAG